MYGRSAQLSVPARSATQSARSSPSSQRRRTVCWAKKDKVEWDDAWSSFKKSSGLSDMNNMVDSNPDVTVGGSSAPMTEQGREIRKQESTLLNVWTKQWFFLLCGFAVFGFMVVMVGVVGPPPSDGRCTLPWC